MTKLIRWWRSLWHTHEFGAFAKDINAWEPYEFCVCGEPNPDPEVHRFEALWREAWAEVLKEIKERRYR